jgi:hypothetical protein
LVGVKMKRLMGKNRLMSRWFAKRLARRVRRRARRVDRSGEC